MDRKDAAKMLTWQHILAILGKACNGNLAIIDKLQGLASSYKGLSV